MEAGAAESEVSAVDAEGSSGEDGGFVNDETGRDEAVRAALATGDRLAALTQVAQAHGVPLGRYCMALLGSRTEADDVMRAALLTLDAARLDAAPQASLRAVLMGVVRRECARRLEGRRGGPLRVVQEGERPDELEGAAHERAMAARTRIAALRPTEREALLARFVAQLSYPEIAVAWEIDEAEIRRRVSRALATLAAGAP